MSLRILCEYTLYGKTCPDATCVLDHTSRIQSSPKALITFDDDQGDSEACPGHHDPYQTHFNGRRPSLDVNNIIDKMAFQEADNTKC